MITFEKCLRLYRFYEALAIYDLYYERVDTVLERNRTNVMAEDRPLTWVPLVFHGTTFSALNGILYDGCIMPGRGKSYVSLTELPIDQLSRLRCLGPRVSEVAIGFPRALLETHGLFQPAYLKHSSSEVKAAFAALPPGYIELDEDLGALHEVRVPGNLPLNDAVWILSSLRNEETKGFDHPTLLRCKSEYGIALSYWHPSHQRGMVKEPVFRNIQRTSEGYLSVLLTCGAHYLPSTSNFIEKEVTLPAGRAFNLKFPTTPSAPGWEGPFTNIEMAMFCYDELIKCYPNRALDIHPRIKMH